MRILVTGSRAWSDTVVIAEALRAYARDDGQKPTLVHGGAKGADHIAANCARRLGWIVESHYADWRRHGKSAGHLRNQEMVDLGADVCLAFPLPGSRGTWDCVRRARQAGIPVKFPAGTP